MWWTLIVVGAVIFPVLMHFVERRQARDQALQREGRSKKQLEEKARRDAIPFGMRGPEFPDWNERVLRGFRDGEIIGDAKVEVHSIGKLSCPSGSIVACDPLVFPEETCFMQQVPVGEHAVVLSIARFDKDARVAFAKLQIEDVETTRWEMATPLGENPATLGEGESFAYGVDAGMGSFFDKAVQDEWINEIDRDLFYDEVLAKKMVAPDGTWDYCLYSLASGNVAIVHSGWGDGLYSSYFGFVEDRVVCLVTDFQVFRFESDEAAR